MGPPKSGESDVVIISDVLPLSFVNNLYYYYSYYFGYVKILTPRKLAQLQPTNNCEASPTC